MTATLRPLDPPHKGLRNLLAQFSLAIGVTEFTDPDSVARLRALGDDLFLLLAEHAQTEDAHVLAPLEARVPGSTGTDLAQHEILEQRCADLQQRLHAFDGAQDNAIGHEYLLDFSQFHADYLTHMVAEERGTEVLVRQNFTDDELIADQVAIGQEMPFDVLLRWFRCIAPARRPAENAQVLRDFRTAAPAEAVAAVEATLAEELAPDVFTEVLELAAVPSPNNG